MEFLGQVNPYRQPVSCKGADNAMPSYANGFIFGMILGLYVRRRGREVRRGTSSRLK